MIMYSIYLSATVLLIGWALIQKVKEEDKWKYWKEKLPKEGQSIQYMTFDGDVLQGVYSDSIRLNLYKWREQ